MGTTADKAAHRTFADPIPLTEGGELRTLRDAGNFIARLPKREHNPPEWLAGSRLMQEVASGFLKLTEELPALSAGFRAFFTGV
jgi:hypothetical protein